MANPNLRKPSTSDTPEPVEPIQVNDPRTAKVRIEAHQMKEWASRLNISTTRLREAVRRVGPAVDDVKRFIAHH